MALNKLKRYDESLKRANQALSLNANNQIALNEKQKAVEILNYEQSSELNQQGLDLFNKGYYEKANGLFAEAYQIVPSSYRNDCSAYLSNQAAALIMLACYEEASIKAKQALNLNPQNEHAGKKFKEIETKTSLFTLIRLRGVFSWPQYTISYYAFFEKCARRNFWEGVNYIICKRLVYMYLAALCIFHNKYNGAPRSITN